MKHISNDNKAPHTTNISKESSWEINTDYATSIFEIMNPWNNIKMHEVFKKSIVNPITIERVENVSWESEIYVEEKSHSIIVDINKKIIELENRKRNHENIAETVKFINSEIIYLLLYLEEIMWENDEKGMLCINASMQSIWQVLWIPKKYSATERIIKIKELLEKYWDIEKRTP